VLRRLRASFENTAGDRRPLRQTRPPSAASENPGCWKLEDDLDRHPRHAGSRKRCSPSSGTAAEAIVFGCNRPDGMRGRGAWDGLLKRGINIPGESTRSRQRVSIAAALARVKPRPRASSPTRRRRKSCCSGLLTTSALPTAIAAE